MKILYRWHSVAKTSLYYVFPVLSWHSEICSKNTVLISMALRKHRHPKFFTKTNDPNHRVKLTR